MMQGMTVIQLQARLQSPGDLGRAARALWPSTATREALAPAARPLLARLDSWVAASTRPCSAPPAAHLLHPKGTTMTLDLRSFLPSVLRTVVPLIVGVLLGLPIVKALGITSDQMTELATAVVTLAYWLVVRGLEQFAPQFGWLLGYAAQPVYTHPADAGVTASPAGDVARVVGS
jgi:hypothetical protein